MKSQQDPLLFLNNSTTVKPAKAILAILPSTWVPYAELARIHRPVGILNIYFPYLFGCLFASLIRHTAPQALMIGCGQMLIAAFILRSLGCAWNDIVDRQVDADTERCRDRPMARGAISLCSAYIYCGCLLALWFYTLGRCVSRVTFLYALPVPVLAALYPYAKRFTDFPQAVLGFTLSCGTLVGTSHLEAAPHELVEKNEWSALIGLLYLFLAYLVWTLIHDTVYGFQDLKDDKRSGVKSMSVKFEDHAIVCLIILSILQEVTLTAVGYSMSATLGYYLLTCGCIALLLFGMIWNLDINSPKKCLRWFQYGSVSFGILVASGLLCEYLARK